ncbi:hypothetical protein CEXT_422151 [Caerostris extrusa]|uniref:Uncharacterized protein n=1 Tax=Caerostris extrusa TaxID=172846 RepID=A0AAV4QGT5_CAEEX|nr:hypothetical protein CEXT_422151 [Caerostris extrusa]
MLNLVTQNECSIEHPPQHMKCVAFKNNHYPGSAKTSRLYQFHATHKKKKKSRLSEFVSETTDLLSTKDPRGSSIMLSQLLLTKEIHALPTCYKCWENRSSEGSVHHDPLRWRDSDFWSWIY